MLNNFSFTVVLAILWSIFFWKNDTFAFEIQDSNLTTYQVAAVTQIRAVGLQTVGSVIVWNQAGDPGDMYNDDGMPVWLECDGSSFDTGYYTALAGIIPSGVLPNLKDQFLRGDFWSGWADCARFNAGTLSWPTATYPLCRNILNQHGSNR